MSEYHYPPFPRFSVKDMPDVSYPQPKCDPKKVITLPPAASTHDLGMPASLRYRGGNPRPQEHTSEDEEEEYGKATIGDDTPPSLPYARPSSAYSPPSPRSRLSPAVKKTPGSRLHTRPDSTRSRVPADVSSKGYGGARHGQKKKVAVEGRNSYGAPQTVRGSTIPREPQLNSISSPAARPGRGNTYGLSKTIRSPAK